LKRILLINIILVFVLLSCDKRYVNEYKPSHPYIEYIGRYDFSEVDFPKTWASGAYVSISFYGSEFSFDVKDYASFGEHNIIEYKIDDFPLQRVLLSKRNTCLEIPFKLASGKHSILICKATESGIGAISFTRFYCSKLLKVKTKRTIFEFIGDSITCGNGILGNSSYEYKSWYSCHSSYYAFGPVVARRLKVNWLLSSVSGIGVSQSCCGNINTIQDVYSFIDLSKKSILYCFENQDPKIVFICLGQNDGFMKGEIFQEKYLAFLNKIESYYPNSSFVCLNSPMAKIELKKYLRKNITQVVAKFSENKKSIYYFEFQKRYHKGVKNHPNIKEHGQMADELLKFIKQNHLI
jgi:lysophospholipase L1-like esterase